MVLSVVPGSQAFAEESIESVEEVINETAVISDSGMMDKEKSGEELITPSEPAAEEITDEDDKKTPSDAQMLKEGGTITNIVSPTMGEEFDMSMIKITENENGWVTYSKTEEQLEARKEQIHQEVQDNREAIYEQRKALHEQGVEYMPHNNPVAYSATNLADGTKKLVGGFMIKGEAERLIYHIGLGENVNPFLYDMGRFGTPEGFKTIAYYKEDGTSTLTKSEGWWQFDYYTYSVDVSGVTVSPYFFNENGACREGGTKAIIDVLGCDLVIDFDQDGNLIERYQYWESSLVIDVLISEQDFGFEEDGFIRTYMVKPGESPNLEGFSVLETIVDSNMSDNLLDKNGCIRADV